MTLIKICGLTNYDDARLALDLGADALGFNFSPGSPRRLSVGDAQAIVRRLPASAWIVGVFVNQSRSEVEEIARGVPLDTLQFHGDEDVTYCAQWREWRVLKAVRPKSVAEIETARAYRDAVDFLLFDRFSEAAYGGTGIELEPAISSALASGQLLEHAFLSGGLSPDNVHERVQALKPLGVDVASGIEVNPRLKSAERMKAFFNAVRAS